MLQKFYFITVIPVTITTTYLSVITELKYNNNNNNNNNRKVDPFFNAVGYRIPLGIFMGITYPISFPLTGIVIFSNECYDNVRNGKK